jgi:hypothetical protein
LITGQGSGLTSSTYIQFTQGFTKASSAKLLCGGGFLRIPPVRFLRQNFNLFVGFTMSDISEKPKQEQRKIPKQVIAAIIGTAALIIAIRGRKPGVAGLPLYFFSKEVLWPWTWGYRGFETIIWAKK